MTPFSHDPIQSIIFEKFQRAATKKRLFALIGVIALLAVTVLIFGYIANPNKRENIEGSWMTRDVKQFGREGPLAVTYQFHEGELVIKRLFQDGEYSSKSSYKLDGNMLTSFSPVDRMYDLKFQYDLKDGGLVMRCVSETPEWKGAVLHFETRK